MAMRRLAAESETEGERTRWVKMELALVLGEATGRRLGAIRQLRWDDILWDTGVIRWRAEADKKRREWVVPMPAALCGELRQFRCKLGAVGGWVFAAERNRRHIRYLRLQPRQLQVMPAQIPPSPRQKPPIEPSAGFPRARSREPA